MAVSKKNKPQSNADSRKSQRNAAFIFGIVFITAILVLAVIFPDPTPFQYTIFRIVISLAAAGVAAMIPGFLTMQVSTWLRAGGALAVFVLIYLYNPAALISKENKADKTGWIEIDKNEITGLASTLDSRS